MKENLVLDAGILSLHFVDHPGVRKYFDAIFAHRSKGLICSFHLSEFYYRTCRSVGKQTADTWYFQIRGNPDLAIVQRDELIRAAGVEKCKQSPKLSLADCFALALAKSEGALLITTDSELGRVRDIDVDLVKI